MTRSLGHPKASMSLDTYADLFDEDLDWVAHRPTTLSGLLRRLGGRGMFASGHNMP